MRKLLSAITAIALVTALLYWDARRVDAITETFTSSTTWVAPANVTSVTVEVWGAGGNGASRNTNGNGGGGGGGAYSRKVVGVTPGASYTVTVGATSGADSWFLDASTVLAKGGTNVATNVTTGGAGGQASAGIGDTKYSGGTGGTADASWSGGGGGGAGTSAAGGDASAQTAGTGGSTGGGNGAGGLFADASKNGDPGATIGGGGSGATRAGSNRTGGSGARGEARLTYTPASAGSPSGTNMMMGSSF